MDTLGTRKALRILGIALALAFCAWSVHAFSVHLEPILRNHSIGSRSDFAWYYVAFQTIWERLAPSVNLYNVVFEDRFMILHHIGYDHLDMFSYPPMFALLFSPFAALGYSASRQMWSIFTVVAFIAALVPATLLACPSNRPARRIALFSLGFWAFPLFNNFYWGQSDTITLLVVALGLWLILGQRREIAGGALLGLGAMLKVTPAITLVYLLLRGRWRAVAGGLGLIFVGSIVTSLLLSWHTLVTYLRQVLPAVQRSAFAHGPAPWNQSFRGLLMRWLHRPPSIQGHWADAFTVACVLGLAAVAWLRPGLDRRLEAAGLALLPMLGSPSLETHHFVLAILPEILLAGYLLDHAAQVASWPLVGALVAAVVLLAVPNYKYVPDVGRYLFGPKGIGFLPLKTPLEHVVSNAQHFWCIALLLVIVIAAALLVPSGKVEPT